MRILPFLAMIILQMHSSMQPYHHNMPSMTQEHPCLEKAGARKSPKIQLCQQTVQQLFFAKPSTTMHDTATMLTHMEWAPFQGMQSTYGSSSGSLCGVHTRHGNWWRPEEMWMDKANYDGYCRYQEEGISRTKKNLKWGRTDGDKYSSHFIYGNRRDDLQRGGARQPSSSQRKRADDGHTKWNTKNKKPSQ